MEGLRTSNSPAYYDKSMLKVNLREPLFNFVPTCAHECGLLSAIRVEEKIHTESVLTPERFLVSLLCGPGMTVKLYSVSESDDCNFSQVSHDSIRLDSCSSVITDPDAWMDPSLTSTYTGMSIIPLLGVTYI